MSSKRNKESAVAQYQADQR